MSNIHLSPVGRILSPNKGRYAAFGDDISPLCVIGREWPGDRAAII